MKTGKLIFALVFLMLFADASMAAKWKAKHVVLIGLDGWGAYSVNKAEMPNVKKLMEEGSYTLKKRSVLPSSSAVNWASMYMGAGPELHGYTEWGSQTPELPSRVVNKHGIFPTVFSLLRESDPKAEIGCICEWAGIRYVVDTLALSYDKNITEKPQIRPLPNVRLNISSVHIRHWSISFSTNPIMSVMLKVMTHLPTMKS